MAEKASRNAPHPEGSRPLAVQDGSATPPRHVGLRRRSPARSEPSGGARAAAFLRGLLSDPLRTGAISPSGRRLAQAMAAQVDPARDGAVIELGPGTGVVTEALIRRGVTPERLMLVEFNPKFCELLARRFPAARIVEADAYAAETFAAQDIGRPAAIVSGLPLLNRPFERRVTLIAGCLQLTAPGMPFVQFSYGFGPPVPGQADFCVSLERRVWLNLPPAAVWVYRRTG